jgi:osmotically-inducible protein OsmY
MGVFALGGALGALLAYFLDPNSGTRRRHELRDRTASFFRRRAGHAARGVAADAYGFSQRVRHLKEEPKDFDDATLADKIRSEVFRDRKLPKGKINVNVQGGIAQLRGEVPRAELIDDLVEQTRRVQGVREVENLLHVSGTEAPRHE